MNGVEEKIMYTNQESAWAAKIAYLELTYSLLEDSYALTENSEPTIGELCDYCVA